MKKIMNLALTGLIAGVCLYANELAAWQRTALDECKQDAKNCTKSPDECKKEAERCKKDAHKSDEDTFEHALSPYANSIFVKFPADKRKQALDYADHNKMSPDNAVAKVAGECFCPK